MPPQDLHPVCLLILCSSPQSKWDNGLTQMNEKSDLLLPLLIQLWALSPTQAKEYGEDVCSLTLEEKYFH